MNAGSIRNGELIAGGQASQDGQGGSQNGVPSFLWTGLASDFADVREHHVQAKFAEQGEAGL